MTTFTTVTAAIADIANVAVAFEVVFIDSRPPMLELSDAVRCLKSLPAFAVAHFVVLIADTFETSLVPAECEAMIMPGEPTTIRRAVSHARTR